MEMQSKEHLHLQSNGNAVKGAFAFAFTFAFAYDDISSQMEMLNKLLHLQSDHVQGLDFFFSGAKGGGAFRVIGANKASTHPVIAIILYTFGAEVKAACALEVEAIGAMDLVEVETSCLLGALDVVEAMRAPDFVEVESSYLLGPLDVVGVYLNILIPTSLKQTTSSSLEKPSSLDT
ncbi:hypothetical protein Tco_0889350 [Tanacetum coccineum]